MTRKLSDEAARSARLGVVLGSTRPGRRGDVVASWLMDVGRAHLQPYRGHVTLELLDLAQFGLPVLDEPEPAAFGRYARLHTHRWASAIDACDGFVFVTPEYNRSLPGALKNAIDYLFAEWHDKAAGFVGYGVAGGVRAVEHLRQVLGELRVATVRTHVALSLAEDLSGEPIGPRPRQVEDAQRMLDELLTWTGALQAVRRG
jgi:NAD(P)H-dependent FMN reductase